MNKNIVIGILAATTLLFGMLYLGQTGFLGASSGPQHYNAEYFYNGLTSSGALTQSGAATFSSTVTIGSSGTAVSNYYCGSVSYNLSSLATAATSTTGFTLTGVALGDTLTASLATSTQGIELHPYVNQAASTTVLFINNTGGTLDLATSTLKVCYTH